MRSEYIQFRRRILLGLGTVLTAGLLLSACSDATGPSRTFMLRYPDDPGLSGATPFTISEDGTETIDFEWEAAPGATRYEITFWRADDLDSVNQHLVDFDQPTFSVAVSSPEVVLVWYDEGYELNGEYIIPPDERELPVVQHSPTHSELVALMQSAGLAADELHYFVWSVYAEDSSGRWRSPENHRLSLEWQPSP